MEKTDPTRESIDGLSGATLLVFGAVWCGHCQAAQATIKVGLATFPHVRYINIEDGKGRRLGRSFQVKLWPTLVFIRDGIERTRLVREIHASELKSGLALISDL